MLESFIAFALSGGLRRLIILLVLVGLVFFVYKKHREIVYLEKQFALQQYNITQLEQSLKDKDIYIKQMEAINNEKGKIVAQLYIDRDMLEEKLSKVLANINTHVGAGHDKESSQILKDTIRMLGDM